MLVNSKPKVFITGASGCVGHYVIDQLVQDYQLTLLVRNPAKLRFNPAQFQNITIIPGDMDLIPDLTTVLSQMDYCIHIATAWGGAGTERINVDRVNQLFNSLSPARLRRVIYFSTASILGAENKILPEAEQYGTDYIKTKYRCYTHLAECWCNDRIVTVFPTLVFGGDAVHPFSHLSSSIPQVRRFAWLLGRLNIDLRFHYIHAQDIAKIVKQLLELPQVKKDYVLGNPALSFGEFSKRAARFFGHHLRWQVKLSPRFIYKMIATFGAEVSAWDRFLVQYQNFCYDTVDCTSFQVASNYSQVEELMADWQAVSKT